MAQRIRKGDLVQVIAGKERHAKKQGRVIEIDTERDRVRVEGVRNQKRHQKPSGRRPGGIIEREGFIHISNVQLVDTKAGKPSRVKIVERDGKRVRVFKKSGDLVPTSAKK